MFPIQISGFFSQFASQKFPKWVAFFPPKNKLEQIIYTAAVLCPWARHFTPRKYWLITQEAVAPSQHDWTSSPKGNDRSPESNVPMSNLI